MKDLEAVLRTERAVNVRTHVESEAKLLAEHAPLNPMRRDIAEVEAFISSFGPTNFSWRRPILVITGPTRLGKSLLAADVLLRVAKLLGLHRYLEVTVEDDVNLDLSAFDVSKHSGVLLDGVGDALMLEHHREALQGRPKTSTGGRSATMVYSYPFSLARRGVIATMDPSAKNLEALQTHHWLSDRRNVIWVADAPLVVGQAQRHLGGPDDASMGVVSCTAKLLCFLRWHLAKMCIDRRLHFIITII